MASPRRSESLGSSVRPRRGATPAPHTIASDDALADPAPPTDDTPTIITRGATLPVTVSLEEPNSSVRGRHLAHFELLEPIGVGGMAAVIRARDTQLDRLVALKILPPEMAVDEENVRRFHQEARSAAKLDHENIARVFLLRRGSAASLHRLRVRRGRESPHYPRATRPVARWRSIALHAPGGRRAGARLAARRRPSRHQAVEHHRHTDGPGQARRYGPGSQSWNAMRTTI